MGLNFTNHGSEKHSSFVDLDEAFVENVMVVPEFLQSLTNEFVFLATVVAKMSLDNFLGGLLS